MKVIIVTQARIGSSRLPGKVLKKINNQSLLHIHLSRLKKSKLASKIIVATTFEDGVEQIIEIGNKMSVDVLQGSTDDVLDRFYQSVKEFTPDYVVRVTSDCPLIDAEVIDQVINLAISGDYDYCSNVLVQDYPDGQDVEVFKMKALTQAWNEAKESHEREHVTPYIWKNSDFNGGNLFKSADLAAPSNYNAIRMTVDEPLDFEVVKLLIETLGTEKGWMDYTQFIMDNPELIKNADIIRNEGYLKSLLKDSHE